MEENGTSSSYSYPISSTISSEAKHLISHLLVNNPDNRYTVSDALNHPFFSENRIPDRIPTSALRLMPTQDEMFTNYSQQSNHASKVASMLEKAKKSNIFNEIDPINQPLKILKGKRKSKISIYIKYHLYTHRDHSGSSYTIYKYTATGSSV